ncbi:sulfonate ABC transporter substrate-binding protein [Burkholderia latens]|uniref:Putative aliphatic sulfonates-binding protein n=1 Tax=Burkholderia latens TaxID=488446 RepID=A0A6H9TCC6_9BURK|nr:sulfonate ABC transporter substrate-binding protein [Burkholderia latens]KAB0641084.1 sulfonate ABC transporter substrate-binding protein [Burkholderia latens]VWB12093.1 aliphatic sulfonate ABC transporter periplasmic ligand-binding protein [Burkholderia latens]
MIRFPRWITRVAATALVAVAATSAFAQSSPDKLVRIGYQKAGLLAVLKTQGALEARLKPLGYDVQWFEFPAGPQLLEALNANSIDFGYTGAPPPVFAQAAGVRFVYVAAEPPSPHNEAIFVKADSPIRSLSDLRGKKVALQKGSSANYLLLEALKKAGVRYDEIRPVYLPPADARAAFESGNVDAWAVWDPYYAAAQNSLKIRTLSDYSGLTPANNFYEATRGFAEQHADVVGAIVKQLRETGLWVNGHPTETAALIAPKVGLPLPLVETWIKRVPFGAVPVDEQIVAVQQRVADAFYTANLIPRKLNVAENAWIDKRVANALAAK